MGIWELLGISTGVGFLAGIRLYATVLAMGLAIRYDWIQLAGGQSDLNVLAQPVVLIGAGVACVVELLADKIAWLDTLWDGVHTLIRPVGAALLGAAAFAHVDPGLRVVLILLTGGVALTAHASKAATRAAVNTSPEPVSNIAVSVVEDAMLPAGIWLVVQHPLVMLAMVTGFLVVFAWLFTKIVRFLRRRWSRRASAEQVVAPTGAEPG